MRHAGRFGRIGLRRAGLLRTGGGVFAALDHRLVVMNKRRLLFVCVENSNRSQMAEAFARLHGGEAVEVYSAGSRPSGVINPRAVDAMRELGYDLTRHSSKCLAEIPDVEFDFVATMGCG